MCPITAVQLEKRRAHLGSSDLAALINMDKRRNRYDLWLDKTGKLEPEKERDTQNDPKIAGKILEPAVLQWAELRLGALTCNQYRSAKDQGLPIGVNIDAILNETGIPVEAKTSGLYGWTGDTWGAENSDEVPDHILIQTQGHAIATKKDTCYVPVFIAFRGFAMFQVPRDIELSDYIGEQAISFWEKNVLADIPPEDITPHPGIVKRVRREANKTVSLDQGLVDTWQSFRDHRLAAEKEEKNALAAILASIGDAEAGQAVTGLFTYLESNRAGYTVEPSTFRTARFKRNK
ncbi:MAG: YqaJ viral recombinase family protein [Acidobacteriota bacterium]